MSLWKKIKGMTDPDPLLDQDQLNAIDEMTKAVEQQMYSSQNNAWISRSSLSPGLSSMLPAGTQVVHVSDPSLIPSSAQPLAAGGQLAGLAGMSSGTIYVDTTTGTIYTTGTQLDPFKELTPEEKERLKNLEEDRKRETKRAKLDIFKKLPATMRQQVVDHFIWSDAVGKMNATEVPKSKEQEELERRDHVGNMYRGFLGGGYVAGGYGGMRSGLMDHATIAEQIYGGGFLRGLILPRDLTPDELIRAHAEATAEEALLGTDTESK